MNILMVGPSKEGKGGISTVVNNYFDSDLINEFNIIYIPTAIEGNKLIKALFWVYAYIKIFIVIWIGNIQLVHIHMASRGSYYRKSKIVKISRLFKKKTIIHLHGAQFDVFYNNECSEEKKSLIRKTFDIADRIIVLSEQWKDFVETITKTQIHILYNAVSINEINNVDISNEINLTFLGRVDKRKGIYDLLEATKKVIDIYNNIKLNIAGDGEIEELKELVKNSNLIKNVDILGWINNKEKEELLRKTYLYILPSYNEGMPMSILEAMSYGIPVISTYVGGIPSVIVNDLNGILIEAGDIDALASSIKYLIEDKNKYTEISKNAYNTINDTFSLNRHIEFLEGIYKSLVEI